MISKEENNIIKPKMVVKITVLVPSISVFCYIESKALLPISYTLTILLSGSSSANVSKSPSPRNQSSTPKAVTKVPAPNLANLKVEPKARDTDSDSGISVEISTGTSAPSTSIFVNEPLTTFEQEKPLPNYCRMVQEAIIALSLGVPSPEAPPGCSLLGIFLYILKHFPDARENVVVMNTKIRSTLALLKRMGIIDSLNDDEKDDLLITSDLPKVEEEPEEKAKVSKDSTPKAKVMKSKANLAAIEAKKKASKMIVKKAKVLNNKQGNGKKKKSGNAVLNSGSGKENSSSANKQPFNFAAQKPKKLSTALSSVCGGRKQMVRQEAVRAIWIYIKKHKLQDPNQRTIIVCDEKLKAVTKKKRVTCSEVLTCLGQHMTAI